MLARGYPGRSWQELRLHNAGKWYACSSPPRKGNMGAYCFSPKRTTWEGAPRPLFPHPAPSALARAIVFTTLFAQLLCLTCFAIGGTKVAETAGMHTRHDRCVSTCVPALGESQHQSSFEKQWPNGRVGLTRLLKRRHGVRTQCKSERRALSSRACCLSCKQSL